MPNKGYKMYDSEIIEMEDFSFNHYIHHFDEYECENLVYNEKTGAIEIVNDDMEDYLWD